MHNSPTIRARIAAGAFSLLLAFSLFPSAAWADVYGSDIIVGRTVDERGVAATYCPNIVAEAAFTVDEDGKVYFERDADSQRQIASITKVMTALVALQYGNPSDTTITISENAASIGESSAMLQAGDSMTLEVALKAMMICSGNDAAQGIAESMGDSIRDALREAGATDVPDDGYDAFVYAMNAKASELGMTNSLFANPHGLDFDQYEADMYSSARDVATMCQAAMKNELFRSIVATADTTVQVNRNGETADVQLESTDILLGNYDGACGIKTGYTERAGECFAGAVERDGKMIISVVLDSSSETQRFADAKTLDEWVYDNTVDLPLASSTESATYEKDGVTYTVPVVAYVAHAGWIDKTFKATIADPDATLEIFALEGNVSQEVSFDDVGGTVEPGTKVGTVTYYQHNEVVATQDLVAAESCAAPNPFEAIGIWWDRVWRGFSGEATQAESYVVGTIPLVYGANATLGAAA